MLIHRHRLQCQRRPVRNRTATLNGARSNETDGPQIRPACDPVLGLVHGAERTRPITP